MPRKIFRIESAQNINQRLDLFLASRIKHLSRSQLQKLIDQEKVLVNRYPQRSNYRLKKGDRIVFRFDIPPQKKIIPENIPIEILFNNHSTVVINKPSGLVVHPGAGRYQHTLVNALLFHFPEIRSVGPEERPGIVHRLDKETSGIMVIAKSNQSFKELQRQFKHRAVEKSYLGLVRGKLVQNEGRINRPVGRHVKHGERMSIKTRKPRSAETLFTVKKRFADFTLLEIKPITGRTHQIRVHFSSSGHPLAGDTRYGHRRNTMRCPRLFLHALRLVFWHPETGEKMDFSSPLPTDLKKFLSQLKAD